MVQLKYFGDSRDYLKYDLLTFLLEKVSFNRYVFVPMLTVNRHSREGTKRATRGEYGKSVRLHDFMRDCPTSSLKNWEVWIRKLVPHYLTVEPVDRLFFQGDGPVRQSYWRAFDPLVQAKNALVFLDPDTGLETGTPNYLRRKGPEKYVLNEELACLFGALSPDSTLMVYQHLTRNRHQHDSSLSRKVQQSRDCCRDAHVFAYREGDLAFLIMCRDPRVNTELIQTVSAYHSRSCHPQKSLHT